MVNANSPTSFRDRRASQRLPYTQSVDISFTDVMMSFSLESCDLSPGGLFVETDLLFSLGETIEVSIPLPGQLDAVELLGRVVRLGKTDGRPAGVGIKWVDLSREQAGVLSRLRC